MQNIIYANQEHKSAVDVYINMCMQFAKDVSSESRYNSYLDITKTIIDYSNGYGEGTREHNFYDWIVILPINMAVMTNGFFAGIETKRNSASIRAYKVILDEMLHQTMEKIDALEFTNE